jgi:long-chain-fatty-acyl-CoA reductase
LEKSGGHDMTDKKIELPIIIQGKPIYPSVERDNYVLSYDSDLNFIIPKINASDLDILLKSPRHRLHNLNIQEIISFLLKVGRFWLPENIDHPLYQNAIEYLTHVNGYDFKMAQRELNLISACCAVQGVLFDLLDAELGNRLYLEEWLPRGDALVHAEPVGNILHILVGNVPVSTIMSVIRSIITKNQTFGKLPSRDPITTLFFALSMLEIDPEHPVSKSMNIFY